MKKRYKILIAEDSMTAMLYTSNIVRKAGYDPIEAINGKEALQKLSNDSFDMIISDILMPEMDGFQLLKHVKEDSDLRNIPFIFHTATYNSDKDKDFGIKLGVDAYIHKFRDPTELSELIQDVFKELELGKFISNKPKIEQEGEVFKLYSERLINKLEKKIVDLEKENIEHKKAEESLLLYKKIIDSTSGHMSFIDKNYVYQEVNNSYIIAHKKERKEIVGCTIAEIFGNEVFENEIKYKIDACFSGKIMRNENWFNFAGIGERYMDITYYPFYNVDKKISGVIVDSKDITDRKKTEEALKTSEDRLSKTLIAANDGMWDWDLITNKVYFDQRYYEMAGYGIDEFPYEFDEYQKRIHPDDLEYVMTQVRQHIEGKTPRFNVEFRFKKKSEDWLWVMGRGLIVERDKNNKPLRIIGTHSDITKQKEMDNLLKKQNKELIVAKENAELSNSTKDKFFSIIAHDLRSPFSSMLGFAEILEDDYDDYNTDEKKKFINIIHNGLKATFSLLENLLFWSRSQRGLIDFTPEIINLHLLFYKTSALLKLSANDKSIKITNKISEHILVKADEEMLSTIIRNLISNAIKFTPEGGEIIINAQLINVDGKFVEISVKDTGVGIANKIQETLFDIGESTSTKGTKNENGTGLGLILCKEFVEKHGGVIGVESEINKGSLFYFTIPNEF